MSYKTNLTQEQVRRLHDGLHDHYIDNDYSCPNCLTTSYNLGDNEVYNTRVCTNCSYEYYVIDNKTRLV